MNRTSAVSCGLAMGVIVLLSSQPVCGARFKVLHTFVGAPSDGNEPTAALIADATGNFYSTTIAGGTSDYGTVFKMKPDGRVSVLYSFPGFKNDGAAPTGGLVEDKRGNFYGTTTTGGTSNNGTVFKLARDGKETVLYSFGSGGDGAEPFAGVVRDKAGNLYGTTFGGGTDDDGVVYKLAPDGTETILHSFDGSDGAVPFAGLIIDSTGNLVGTTARGGPNNDGTVFTIAPDGTFNRLYAFSGSDGAAPYGGLIEEEPGVYYGTTGEGGANEGGVIFRLTTKGKQSVIYSFTGRQDGAFPSGELIFDANGAIYGTTTYGGNDGTNGCANRGGCGVAYQLTARGTLKVLHAFTSGHDGGNPESALLMDGSGALYGTAGFGGDDQEGVVFRVK